MDLMNIIGIVIGVVLMALLFRPIFGTGENFWDAIKFWLTPDIFSWFNGKGFEDWLGEMRLGIWLGAGFGGYVGTLYIFSNVVA